MKTNASETRSIFKVVAHQVCPEGLLPVRGGRHRYPSILFLAVTTALLVGCASPATVSYTPVKTPSRVLDPRTPQTVEVFAGTVPSRPHVGVGLFEVSQGYTARFNLHTTEQMLDVLREHAASRGCDAITVMGITISAHRHRSDRRIQASCLVYTPS